MSLAPFYFVAIHGGAGYHPPSSDALNRRSLRTAISSTLTTVSNSENSSGGCGSRIPPTALDTATTLIAALEDSSEFNAGSGSNLTFDGDVECDAALMDGGANDVCYTGTFGGVGAVRGVRNPVLLARCILDARRQQQLRQNSNAGLGLERMPPLLLVGEGAVRFAAERGMVMQPTEMVAPRARREWEVWRERWEQEQEGKRRSAGHSSDPELVTMLRSRQDTVGAVVVQGDAGYVAAGVSSGGLLLKPSGRIGEASVFGAGCWAERMSDGRSIACSVSGQGELIMQSSVAKTLAERIAAAEGDTHDVLRSVLVDHFYNKWYRTGEHQPAVGVLLLTRGVDGDESTTRLWCAFTTQSMAVAYSSSQHPKPKAVILRNSTHDFSGAAKDGRAPLFITTLCF